MDMDPCSRHSVRSFSVSKYVCIPMYGIRNTLPYQFSLGSRWNSITSIGGQVAGLVGANQRPEVEDSVATIRIDSHRLTINSLVIRIG